MIEREKKLYMKEVLAWHFVGKKLRDGSQVPKNGVWLKHNGPVVLCASGLHASINPFDALQYAPGATLCWVALRGGIVTGNNKIAAPERKIIARMDATEMLRYFARMQALSCVDKWDAPDVVLDYLMTGNDKLKDAAWDAAREAAWDAAREAARAAARAAAWDAARAAAWDAAKNDFTALVHECFVGVMK